MPLGIFIASLLYIFNMYLLYVFVFYNYLSIFIISVIQISKNPARNFEKIKLLFIFILISLYTRHKPPLRIQISRKIWKSLLSNVNFWILRNFATITRSLCIIYIYHDSIQIIRYFYINSETTLLLHASSFERFTICKMRISIVMKILTIIFAKVSSSCKNHFSAPKRNAV